MAWFSAIDALLLAHLEDEWAHARYSAHLFALIWPLMAPDEQVFFGPSTCAAASRQPASWTSTRAIEPPGIPCVQRTEIARKTGSPEAGTRR
ncbi:hypothetical protein [Hydrogenophaga sp. BPS33]|uniref:hypothetical protein n=1 Tax=Hydrogenophaga sp. BPS33 TaxID=2651974 RepID=UPI00131FD499|nr:hypothetical protein [Hydrogenophaga sp. BPS33]QHE87014.1 hypothetical protein F9K07_19970 [Hydrogenophaga sp. BPS33]